MALEVTVTEQIVPKKTRWGTIQRSLNQHIVHVKNPDTGKSIQCGYVGTSAFLPLPGFPVELVEEVRAQCATLLNRELSAEQPPPTLQQVAEMIANSSNEDDDDE